jgi:hypothetical protein
VGWLAVGPTGGPTSVQQTLGVSVVDGYAYTLSGYVGHPIGFGVTLGTTYGVSILAGGVPVAFVTGTGPEGSFVPFTVNWIGNATYAGQALGIQLYSSKAQTAFDDIKFSVVPEPTTMIAGGLMLLSVGMSTFRILRKQRKA